MLLNVEWVVIGFDLQYSKCSPVASSSTATAA
jgi:hypothetical protein